MPSSILHPPSSSRHRGFSFAEVMFAVVILGVGFIMIAGIFPVALQQTQTNGEQSAAASFARTAAGYMQQIASYNNGQYLPITETNAGKPPYVFSFDSPQPPPATFAHGSWSAVSGSLISSSDPRFAIVPLYIRPKNANYAQLYIINVQARNHTLYSANDLFPPPPVLTPTSDLPATLRPKLVQMRITMGPPSIISFVTGVSGSTKAPFAGGSFYYAQNGSEAVDSGTYVVIANDAIVSGLYANQGLYNGKVYRVGNHRPDLNTAGIQLDNWELMPGSDFVSVNGITQIPPNPFPPAHADAWIIGKGLTVPGSPYNVAGNPPNTYTGAAQDISLYTTYVPLQ